MKIKRGLKHKMNISLMIILAFIFVNLSGCAAGFMGIGDSTSWKEEVLLHDGQKIIIERLVSLGGKPTLDSRERRDLDETVSFILPGSNKKVIWMTDFRMAAKGRPALFLTGQPAGDELAPKSVMCAKMALLPRR